MRFFVGGIIVLVLIACICTLNFLYLRSTLGQTLELLHEIERLAEADALFNAAQYSEEAIKLWGERQTYYKMVLRHGDIDGMLRSLTEIGKSISNGDKSRLGPALNEAKIIVISIVGAESLTIGNVF